MHTKTKLTTALIAAVGLTASTASFAAIDASRTTWTSWQDLGGSSIVHQVAAKGRGGRDDVIERPTCDDRSDDLACILADKGRGKDGTKPEDNGVDLA